MKQTVLRRIQNFGLNREDGRRKLKARMGKDNYFIIWWDPVFCLPDFLLSNTGSCGRGKQMELKSGQSTEDKVVLCYNCASRGGESRPKKRYHDISALLQ